MLFAVSDEVWLQAIQAVVTVAGMILILFRQGQARDEASAAKAFGQINHEALRANTALTAKAADQVEELTRAVASGSGSGITPSPAPAPTPDPRPYPPFEGPAGKFGPGTEGR